MSNDPSPSPSLGKTPMSRRKLLGGAAALGGATAAALALPQNVQKALAAPAPKRSSLGDIEHVVILMQENRSFDHYFGTVAGVRWFGDRHAMTLPSTSHAWQVQHNAWNNGAMDSWLPAHLAADGTNGPFTMGYYERQDIPFQFALAENFTIFDNYHCSVLGRVAPNISSWRRSTVGDLTTGLQGFTDDVPPVLPDTSGPLTLAEYTSTLPLPSFPGANQTFPVQAKQRGHRGRPLQ